MPSQSSQPAFDWPTQEQAAEQLGTTVRTIQRLVSEHKMASRLQPVAGRKPVVLIDPRDIERIIGERRKTVVLPVSNDADGRALAVRHGPDPLEVLAAHLARLATVYPAAQPVGGEKPWLTLDEAASFSGLTRRWLAQEAESGEGSISIRDMGKHARGGRWRFLREDLGKAE